jgi:hypothetical protein
VDALRGAAARGQLRHRVCNVGKVIFEGVGWQWVAVPPVESHFD